MSIRTVSGHDKAKRTATVIDHKAAYTMLAWFRLDTDINNYVHFMHVGGSSIVYDGDTDDLRTPIDGTTFGWNSIGSPGAVQIDELPIALGTWFWCALVRESVSSLKIYRGTNAANGYLVGTVTTDMTARAAATDMAFGGYNGLPNIGLTARPRVWTKALTLAGLHAEVASLTVVDTGSLWSAANFFGANLTAALADTSGNGRDWSAETAGGAALVLSSEEPPISISIAKVTDGTTLESLDSRWGGDSGGIVTAGGAFQTSTAFGDHLVWFVNGQGDDQEVEITVYGGTYASGQIKSPLLQAAVGQSGYRVSVGGSDSVSLARNGTYATGGGGTYTGPKNLSTDTIQLKATLIDGVVRVYIDDVEYLNYTDSSKLTGGNPGFHLYGAGTPSTALIANWTEGTTKFAFSNNGGASAAASTSVAKDLGTVIKGQLVVVWGGAYRVPDTQFIAANCSKASGTAVLSSFTLDSVDGGPSFETGGHYSAMWSAIVTTSGTLTVQISSLDASAWPNIGAGAFNGNWDALRVEAFNGQYTPTNNLTSASTGNMTSGGPALICAGLRANNSGAQVLTEDSAFSLVYEQETGSFGAVSFVYRIVDFATTDAGDWSIPSAATGGTSASGVIYRESSGKLNFGDPNNDVDSFPCSSNRLMMTKFTLTDRADISAVNAHFEKPTTAGNSGKAVIFSDVAGEPGTLLAVSSSKAIPAGATDLGFPVSLLGAPPGDYWLGCVTNSFESRFQTLFGGANDTYRYEGYNFASTPSTLPAPDDAAVGADLNIYASYTTTIQRVSLLYGNNGNGNTVVLSQPFDAVLGGLIAFVVRQQNGPAATATDTAGNTYEALPLITDGFQNATLLYCLSSLAQIDNVITASHAFGVGTLRGAQYTTTIAGGFAFGTAQSVIGSDVSGLPLVTPAFDLTLEGVAVAGLFYTYYGDVILSDAGDLTIRQKNRGGPSTIPSAWSDRIYGTPETGIIAGVNADEAGRHLIYAAAFREGSPPNIYSTRNGLLLETIGTIWGFSKATVVV